MEYQPEVMSQAALDVMAERQRQKDAEGWTPEHDDCHDQGELAMAAACYTYPHFPEKIVGASPSYARIRSRIPDHWPFHEQWWKPKDRRRDLVRASALLIAEIERIDRQSQPFCRACQQVGMLHCAHPEDCKTPEELAAWDRRLARTTGDKP